MGGWKKTEAGGRARRAMKGSRALGQAANYSVFTTKSALDRQRQIKQRKNGSRQLRSWDAPCAWTESASK